MKTAMWILTAVAVVIAAGLAWLAWAQNVDQVVQLRFDLGASIGAWQMASPLPAVALAAGAFGIGLLLGALLVLVGRSLGGGEKGYGDL